MVMLVILVLGASSILVSSLSSSGLRIERDKITAEALAQAKEALIGRAVSNDDRPGSLPCPDTNNDGSSELLSGNDCPSYIGRLPWKTLRLSDLRDGSGERLWYALSPNFRDDNSNPINSNNKGTLQVYDNNGTNLLTPPGSEAVTVVFAPGDIVAAQLRDTANQNLALNYLDIGPSGINNATEAGPLIAADKTNSFNDRLMIIRASDLIPIVEIRVTKELTKAFASYLTANANKYPYPANFTTTCTSTSCPSDTTQCRGKIPATLMNLYATLPWFTNNNWFNVIYYTAGTASLPGGAGGGGGGGGKAAKGKKTGGGGSGGGSSSGVTTCPGGNNGKLNVLDTSGSTFTNNASALFFMPGSPLDGITRTSTGISSTNLPDYFEDAENTNLDDTYTFPGVDSNDLLFILP